MEMQFNFNSELSNKIALVTGGTKGTGKANFHSMKAHYPMRQQKPG
ncbi:hypothetical protein [Pedobacter sp. KBS0701]|nr:hypothetical protein [Pedobacter sp. KBS0701]